MGVWDMSAGDLHLLNYGSWPDKIRESVPVADLPAIPVPAGDRGSSLRRPARLRAMYKHTLHQTSLIKILTIKELGTLPIGIP